ERVRKLAREAREQGKAIMELTRHDPELRQYISRMSLEQQQALDDPANYSGQSSSRTMAVCQHWRTDARNLCAYLANERTALSNPKPDRFHRLHEQLRQMEQGSSTPMDTVSDRDRQGTIEELIRIQGG